MNFTQASRLVNDLAFVIVPFDKTTSEYQGLLGKIKTLFRSQQGAVKLYHLVEAMLRLKLDDGLVEVLR